jgi:hypothetical protein
MTKIVSNTLDFHHHLRNRSARIVDFATTQEDLVAFTAISSIGMVRATPEKFQRET